MRRLLYHDLFSYIYFILYSIGRFIIEIFRNDDRGSVGNLSTAQFTGLFMLAGGLISFFILQKSEGEK